jgi:nucleotide-binding universal stress UspA family protein
MRILVATDGSRACVAAARFALDVAAASRSTLIAITVESLLPLNWRGRADRLEAAAHRAAQTALQRIRREATRRGVRVRVESVRAPRLELVAETIARTASRLRGDLVVVGSHGGTPLTRWALGSIANRLVHVSATPVAVVRSSRSRWRGRSWTIVAATDGSRSAQAAVRFAARMASAIPHARLILLTVSTLSADVAMTGAGVIRTLGILPELERADRAAARRLLARAAKQARPAKRVEVREFRPRQVLFAEESIIAAARRERADAVVLGRAGRSALADVILGSVAQRVLARSRTPVVLVPVSRGSRR